MRCVSSSGIPVNRVFFEGVLGANSTAALKSVTEELVAIFDTRGPLTFHERNGEGDWIRYTLSIIAILELDKCMGTNS